MKTLEIFFYPVLKSLYFGKQLLRYLWIFLSAFFRSRVLRNLLLVTGPQLLLGKVLALPLEPTRFDDFKFGSNILQPTLILPTIDDGSTWSRRHIDFGRQ